MRSISASSQPPQPSSPASSESLRRSDLRDPSYQFLEQFWAFDCSSTLDSPRVAGESSAAVVSSWIGAPAPAPGSPRFGMKIDDSVLEFENVENEVKKPAWNKPSNGVVEVSSPVMGAVAWPALGESVKASPKSASSESLLTLSDEALPTLQIAGNYSSTSLKQVTPNIANPSSAANLVAPTRQGSMKRGGGTSSESVNGGSYSPQPHDSVGEIPLNTPRKPAAEFSPKDHPHKPYGGNEQQHQRNSIKRGIRRSHPRGDGSFHHNYGGKRDQDRGNQEWNQQNRGFGSRGAHMQPHGGFSSKFIRTTPFIVPPVPGTVRPTFVNPMGYSDVPPHPLIYVQGPPPPDSLRAMPMVTPIPPHGIFFPVPDPQLHVPDLQLHMKIVNQIDYYFSNANLVKDLFLRKNMDGQGWVPIKLIAGFKKVSYLTENITLIAEAMRNSTLVEVQGDKLRRRNDWMKWLMPLPVEFSNVSIPRATNSSTPDMLASSLENIALDEKTSNLGNSIASC